MNILIGNLNNDRANNIANILAHNVTNEITNNIANILTNHIIEEIVNNIVGRSANNRAFHFVGSGAKAIKSVNRNFWE